MYIIFIDGSILAGWFIVFIDFNYDTRGFKKLKVQISICMCVCVCVLLPIQIQNLFLAVDTLTTQ